MDNPLPFLFSIFAYAHLAFIYSVSSKVYPFQEPQNGPTGGSKEPPYNINGLYTELLPPNLALLPSPMRLTTFRSASSNYVTKPDRSKATA